MIKSFSFITLAVVFYDCQGSAGYGTPLEWIGEPEECVDVAVWVEPSRSAFTLDLALEACEMWMNEGVFCRPAKGEQKADIRFYVEEDVCSNPSPLCGFEEVKRSSARASRVDCGFHVGTAESATRAEVVFRPDCMGDFELTREDRVRYIAMWIGIGLGGLDGAERAGIPLSRVMLLEGSFFYGGAFQTVEDHEAMMARHDWYRGIGEQCELSPSFDAGDAKFQSRVRP